MSIKKRGYNSIKLFIIRHGQPLSQEIGESIPNTPLGERGKMQAIRAAEELAKFEGIDYLYSSTYCRALETAQPFYDKYKVPWHVWPALSETGRRSWPRLRELEEQGQRVGWSEEKANEAEKGWQRDEEHSAERYPLISEIAKLYPGTQMTQPFPWPDAWWLPLQDETRELTYERGRKCIEGLKERHGGTDCNIAVVCHGAFGSVLMTLLTEGTPCDHNRFSFAHAAISCVELFEDGTTQVLISCHIGHLYPDYLTEY